TGIGRERVDLSPNIGELCREGRSFGRIRSLYGLTSQCPARLDELGDRRNAVVRGLNRLDRTAHRVQQAAEVACTVAQRLRSEEVARIVERRVDPLAGRETHLRLLNEAFRRLQIKQV